MATSRQKHPVSRLLKTSIIELCKASVPRGHNVEIDGIVCITIGDEEEQVVVKIHEKLDEYPAIRQATSSQSLANGEQNGSSVEPLPHNLEVINTQLGSAEMNRSLVNTRRKQPMPCQVVLAKRGASDSEALAAAAKRACLDKQCDNIQPSTLNAHQPGSLTDTTLEAPPPAELKQEPIWRPVDDSSKSKEPIDYNIQTCTMERYIGNASLDTTLSKDFVCEYCQVMLNTFEQFRNHNERVHNAYTCSFCWRSFVDYTNYQIHLKTSHRLAGSKGDEVASSWQVGHHAQSLVTSSTSKSRRCKKCGACGETYRNMTSLVDHMRLVHQFEKYFTCSTCQEIFPSRRTFVAHRKLRHTDAQQCRCENCEVYFTYVEFKHHERECISDCSPALAEVEAVSPEKGTATHGSISTDPGQDVGLQQDDHVNNAQVESGVGQKHPAEPTLDRSSKVGDDHGDKDAAAEENMSGVDEDEVEEDEDHDGYEADSDRDDGDHSAVKGGEALTRAEKIHGEESNHRATESYAAISNADDSEDSQDTITECLSEPDGSPTPSTSKMGSDGKASTSKQGSHSRVKIIENITNFYHGPFGCQVCFEVYDNFEAYETHCFERHSRYVCPKCAGSFANRRNLIRHMRKHTGNKPYECGECGQKFYRDDELKRHKEKHRECVQTKIVCCYCCTQFEDKDTLLAHLTSEHGITEEVFDEELTKHIVFL